MSRADMESASPRRHTLQAAVFKPEELSALCGVGGTRLAMMVDQIRRKVRWGELKARRDQVGMAKLCRFCFLVSRVASSNGAWSRSVAKQMRASLLASAQVALL